MLVRLSIMLRNKDNTIQYLAERYINLSAAPTVNDIITIHHKEKPLDRIYLKLGHTVNRYFHSTKEVEICGNICCHDDDEIMDRYKELLLQYAFTIIKYEQKSWREIIYI